MSVLKIKDGSGNWVVVPALNGTNAVGDVMVNGTSVVSNGVAQIPVAGESYGTVRLSNSYGIGHANSTPTSAVYGTLAVIGATSGEIKAETTSFKPIVPYHQHESTFYGLTKAAGVDMSTSDNAVGTYTSEAKSAIQTMLGIPDTITAELADYEESSSTITNAQIDALFI